MKSRGCLALRHVEQRDALLRAQPDGAGSRGEHAIGACEWRRALLGHFVLQILDQDLPAREGARNAQPQETATIPMHLTRPP